MAKRSRPPGEYNYLPREKDIVDKVKEILSGFIGKEILISSNAERAKNSMQKKMIIYHVGQQYNELGQVLILENPSIPRSEVPQILITPNMEISKKENKVIIRYPRQLSFRAATKPTFPDLEIYIEEAIDK